MKWARITDLAEVPRPPSWEFFPHPTHWHWQMNLKVRHTRPRFLKRPHANKTRCDTKLRKKNTKPWLWAQSKGLLFWALRWVYGWISLMTIYITEVSWVGSRYWFVNALLIGPHICDDYSQRKTKGSNPRPSTLESRTLTNVLLERHCWTVHFLNN